MMKLTFLVTFSVLLALGSAAAESLPAWNKEDRAKLMRGELIAGADIFYEDPAKMLLPGEVPQAEIPPLEPVEPLPAYDPEVIPHEFLDVYFSSKSEDYLVDPQRLLSMQESLDRKGFLEYHASDSELDIRMYLFDEFQKIPEPYSIQKLCQDHYAGEPLTMVVFCFLGDPKRSQIAFGGKGSAEIQALEVRRMLESSKIKAMEKSDPAMQLEAFIVQLSIRLFWLERERQEARTMAELSKNKALVNSAQDPDETVAAGPVIKPADDDGPAGTKSSFPFIIAACLGLLSLSGGAWLGWSLWIHKRRFYFPVLEVPKRLGANYAAGVGAVLVFHNELGSPTSQRNRVSNYLTRI